MKRNSSPFKWRHYAPDVILLSVRWYCRYSLSYRGLEEMMRERGLRHFEPTVNPLCVRWCCRYRLSYRDLDEMICERWLRVDHVTIFRWVQRYAPEINKRMRPHLRMSGTSYGPACEQSRGNSASDRVSRAALRPEASLHALHPIIGLMS
jgi:transposase-like protein